MTPQNALSEFQAFLNERSLSEDSLSVENGFQAMLDFYQGVRAAGCNFDHDQDMLLYQWGTYDWGSGEFTELNLTRQLITSDECEDDGIWQLSLTFRFEPDEALVELGSGNSWCPNTDNLTSFATELKGSAPYTALVEKPSASIALQHECAG